MSPASEVSPFEISGLEGNGSAEGSAGGSNSGSSSTGDSCEAGSALSVEGLQEESKVASSLPFPLLHLLAMAFLPFNSDISLLAE